MKGKQENGIVPIIPKEIVERHREILKQTLEKEIRGPLDYVRIFDKYNQLLSKQAEEEVELFLKEEHIFNEYEREVKKYSRLNDEIQYKSHKISRVGMFELHCDELIRALARRAENCTSKLLERMTKDHFDINKQ